jgi:hypothetical protein
MRRISQELDQRGIDLLEGILRRGNEMDEFQCRDPRASAMRLTGLIDGLAVQFAAHDGVLRRQDLIESVSLLANHETRTTSFPSS